MISELEAQKLMNTLITLRKRVEKKRTKTNLQKLELHEKECMEKFRYLITMRTGKYKSFANYDDLNQEGYEALLKSMKNYNPTKGIFFYWAHKYIDTRISRSANLHTAIRYPLKFARHTTPHKESTIPVMIEPRFNPDKILESKQLRNSIASAMQYLDNEEKDIVTMAFGFTGDKPLSINKICKRKKISRMTCIKAITSALGTLKEKIKL